ncbi:MAG: hypothetical protein NVSMB23_01640 [Myxococcales bacterium]
MTAAGQGSGGRRHPLLGAAVLKALLRESSPDGFESAQALYLGVLRDLQLTDAQVDEFLGEHRDQVEKALRNHGTLK